MSAVRLLYVADALAAAERVLADPGRNAVRISIEERVTLAALVLQQHRVIAEAGLAGQAYPRPPAREAGPHREASA